MRHLLSSLLLLATPVVAQEFFTLEGHGGPIMDIAVSDDGRIATASFDNSLGLWNDGTPTWCDGHDAAVNAIAFAGPTRLVSGADDFSVRIWNGCESAPRVLGRHQGKVTGLAVSRETGLVASASWDGTIGLWPLDGEMTERVLTGHGQGVNDLAFSSDSKRLYSASVDGTIRIWDIAAGIEERQLVRHGFGVNKLVLNEKDGWLAYGAVDGVTRMIDLETGGDVADFTLDRRPILALAFHPQTSQLAVGDGEGYIMVIDTAARRITRDFHAARRGPVWALAFSPDGHNLHAGGIEDVMYSWPVETITEHGQMSTEGRSFLRDPATSSNGERQFMRKCSICHTLDSDGGRKAGPSLHRLFGRPAGSLPDYSYSETLAGSDIIWSEDTIDQLFDLGPDHVVPGSKMPMQRIAAETDREDLIAYLRRATTSDDSREEN